MPHYGQQQFTSLHASTDRRKHLNLLLFDQLEEIGRIYAGTGRWPTYTLAPHRPILRTQTAPSGDQRERFTRQFIATPKGQPPEFSGVGQPLSESALHHMHTLHRPTTAQTPTSPALSYAGASGIAPSQQEPWQGASQAGSTQSYHAGSMQPYQAGIMQTQQAGSLPSLNSAASMGRRDAPWLMPWQTGDRETGKRWAEAIRKKRTPTGAFANLDLAKPAK